MDERKTGSFHLTGAGQSGGVSGSEISGAPLSDYSAEDRAFYSFWYGHMLGDLMQPPLCDVSHATARYIWNAAIGPALNNAYAEGRKDEAECRAAPATQKYDDVLLPFLTLMRRELHANSGKGDRPGWLSMDANTALLEVYWHVAKLSAAVKNNDGPGIMEHGADVANMAMMVLDVCGGLVWIEPDASTESADSPDAQLCKFYGVTTFPELVAAMEHHIEKLQAKLPPTPSFAPQRVREG